LKSNYIYIDRGIDMAIKYRTMKHRQQNDLNGYMTENGDDNTEQEED
jgi:hypothetical protein